MAVKDKCKKIRFYFRDLLINRRNRKRLKNHDFSIICSDCTAGCVCKDLKVRMNSPTRNFYFNADDFIKFCENLDYYLSLSPCPYNGDYKENGTQYTMASLGDLKMFLVHYSSVEQAREEWDRRKIRVNQENIFFVMNDRNYCDKTYIQAFNNLPYKNKVCFTHIPYDEFECTYYITGSEKEDYLESLMVFIKQWWIKRYYDQFDWVSWLNGENVLGGRVKNGK